MSSQRPNLVMIMSDDHAAQAVSAYGSAINETPNIDRIADEGMRFDSCFCTNAICTPSRASILTGTYSHVNEVTTLSTHFDARQPTFISQLQEAGYQTAIVGKWHLGHGGIHDPRGFDYWEVLPDQGAYHDPVFLTGDGEHTRKGYATDLITDLSMDWLDQRDPDRPFCLLMFHKAPHRNWQPDEKHARMYEDIEIPLPATFDDDYSNRSAAPGAAKMRVAEHLYGSDLKEEPPEGITPDEYGNWAYQRYIKDYLRCVASIDDNIGRFLDYLERENLSSNTAVTYTSDQGFFLGEHGWYDKRFMYEESLRMPLVMRYPPEIGPGQHTDAIVSNVDFAQTFLDMAGVGALDRMQGRSMRQLFGGNRPEDWRTSFYYRYWEHDDGIHHVWAHYGIRTDRYKLIYYYNDGLGLRGAATTTYPPEWELFDLAADPQELRSVYDDPDYGSIRQQLHAELARAQADVGDAPHHTDDVTRLLADGVEAGR